MKQPQPQQKVRNMSTGNLNGFDANNVEPNEAFSVLPAGDYPVIITESKMKATKDGTGQYLELKMQVLSGSHQNRIVFDRLNLQNKSEKAMQIAKGTLSAICRAVGIMTPQDSSQLHNKPLIATVKVRKDPQGDMQNDVKGYKAATGGQPAQQQSAPAAPAGTLVEQAFGTPAASESPSPFG